MDDRHFSYITKLTPKKKKKLKTPQVVTSLEKPELFPQKLGSFFHAPIHLAPLSVKIG
jgi:hypothetical protein